MQTNDTEDKDRGQRNVRIALVVLVPLLVSTGLFGFYLISASPAATGVAGGTNAGSSLKLQFDVGITHQEQRGADLLWMAQMALKGQFWSASCIVMCSKGVTYTLDPTIITNQGHGIEQCLVFGTTITGTCTAGNFAKVIGLSASAVAPAAADTAASGPCSIATNLILTNGLIDVAGTVTAAADGPSVVTSIANTFTATGTQANVQVACLLSALASGTNSLVYAEGTFGPDSLVSGNTLTITWSITRT
jgi:hypothetical protein